MFESLVANLLNRFLGSYIENFDPKQLNIGIWNGDVKLKSLRLKKDSLDRFKLPINVKFGHVGELTLQIPWSNLKGQPVKVIIEDVYLLVSPTIVNDFDVDEENAKELKVKRDKLQHLTVIENAQLQNQDILDSSQNESFTESLVTKIIDNLQVTIKNIHIRYEDDSILTESPYSVGITLKELSAVSTDESWIASFISITQKLTRKLLTLQDLSCYMNTDSMSIYNDDPAKMLEIFKSSTEIDDFQYILKPVSGQGKLSLNKLGATESIPHIKAELFFQEFGIDLDSQQYKDMLWTLSKFHWYIKTYKFRKFRPKVSIKDDPKLWFKYAANSVLNEIHEKNYKWSWEYFAKRRDQRKAYVKYYKSSLMNKVEDKALLQELEDELSFEDIKFYRSIARNELRNENSLSKVEQAQAPQSQGWFGGWWGGGNAPVDEDKKEKEDLQLSEDQRKALYEAIDYNENEVANSIDLPRDTVTMEITATLKKGGFSIRPFKNSPSLAEIVFEDCKTQIYQRPDSLLTNFQIQEFRIEDGTENTLYKHIVSVKQYDEQPTKEPFFRVSFENNPLDNSSDSKLLGKLKSMTIFYNPKFIEEIFKFFKPPKIHLDTVGAIMNAAEATMEGFTAQTRIGLQYALEEHKTINVKLDLQAPLIIIPLEPNNWKSPVAILDAGHISVISKLVDKAKIEEMKSKLKYNEEDWQQLNTLMYDTFTLNLQDAQFLVGSNIRDTMSELHFEDHKLRKSSILDKLNIKLLLGISILPDVYNLSRFKISGEVPKVVLQLNDFQYKTIMQIIDASIPNLDENSVEGSVIEESGMFDAFLTKQESTIEFQEHSEVKVSEAAANQNVFEMNFNIKEVHISLSRCIDGITLDAEPFIELIGNGLDLNFYKTMNDMFLDLRLEDIDLIDHIERSGIAEFEKLISSNLDQSIDKPLFKLDYSRKQRLVEFNHKEIEVFDQDIKLDIATVKLVITRKSILSILNFVLNTFTDPNAEATPADELKHNDKDEESAPQKIQVDINLDSIILVLNEDSVKLATLQLSTANIALLILPEAMDISGKLGALTLHDDVNEGSPEGSMLRNLISIEGDNLAQFRYQTFDNETNKELYNSSIDFKFGASKVNFVEASFKRIINYLSQFQRMKEIYDSTREAAINQASQIDYSNKMRFDISIMAPTIIFPKLVTHSSVKYDKLTIELGELYASNKFVEENSLIKNVINAGLRKVNMSSEFNFINDILQKSHMVNGFDLSFDIDYLDTFTVVSGRLPEVELKLTELQLKYLLSISDSVTNVFDTSDINLEDIEEDAMNANAVVKHENKGENAIVNLEDKGANTKNSSDTSITQPIDTNDNSDKLIFNFGIPKLGLTLYNQTTGIVSLEEHKLASFSLNGLKLNFKMTQDSNFESNLVVKSFIVEDVRPGSDSCFREIIPSIKSDKNQFNITATKENKNTTVMLSVDNPKVVLSLDYLFELQGFVNKVLEKPKTISELAQDEDSDSYQEEEPIDNETTTNNMGFSVNIIQPSIILLSDSTKSNTEAIVFKIEQVLITSQNVLSVAANSIGLFLCAADNIQDKRLRIIDDFSISFAHDSRGSTATSFLTNIQASVDPLLLRLSLRDIKLALSIFNRASDLLSKSQNGNSEPDEYTFSENFKKRLSQYAPSFTSSLTNSKKRQIANIDESKVIIKGEELNVSIGGLRFVLIGDVHELPVLDMNIKPFEFKAINWSTDLSAESHIESFIKIYNYAGSTWEPLIESCPIAIYATKSVDAKNGIMVDIVSRELTEITVSSRSIALLSQISSLITEDVQLRSREEASPYKILNETGYDLAVWIDDNTKTNRTIIKNGEQIPWAFEDWRQVRQNLSTDNTRGVLGIGLLNSPYEEVRQISATAEGENIIMITPPINGVHTRLICDISLGKDNVKTIWLRSSVELKNDSDVAISVQISNDTKVIDEIIIESGKSKSLGVDQVYKGTLKFKPNTEMEYQWSKESLYWKDLLYGGSSLTCSSSATGDNTFYYFQAEANYDKDEPLARIYPHMKIVISSPVQVTNLLPFDINYRLYDKGTRKDWNGTILKGHENFIHVASLENLLLLSVEPQDGGCNKSEFAIINVPKQSEFKRENTMTLTHEDGQVIKLKIHYPRKQQGKSGLKVTIYSPYVIVNRTSQNIIISEKSNRLISNGQSMAQVTPKMFSFDKPENKKNRALLRVGDSQYSVPLSFDAVGQDNAVGLQINGKQTEMNVAVSVADGEGKYNLTKVVTITPRYILKNTLDEPLQVVENGSTNVITIQPNELMPLYGLRRNDKKSLVLKFTHDSTWSSPFTIDDIGQLFLKVYKQNKGQVLLKVNILTENGTIFIQLENANNNWPFSIRNYTDTEFFIYQSDPNINENGDVVKTDVNYKPIYYKIPAKSVMPYAYDFPNAIIKELVIRSHGRERAVNLSEIGNLKPFRLPPTQNDEHQLIVDLNVVADGPTQSLIISEYDPSVSMYKLQRTKTGASNASSQQNFEASEKDENYHTKIITRFEGFGISLINSHNHELLYVTLRGIEIRYNESDLYQNLSVKLKWIQVDNQLYGGIFPIIIYPTVVPKSGKEMNNHPSFSASVCKVKDDSHGVLFIKYATILLQEMTIEIDEDFLFALLDFAKIEGASWNQQIQDKLCDDNIDLPEPKRLSETSDIYFEALHLQPISTNLSFVRTERVNAEDKAPSQSTLMFFFNILTMAIGNINDAPIKLNALFIENVRVPMPILLESIQSHYGQAFFYQLHKLLGSADFIGNPVGLFNNIASGVLDIFYEPYQGFVINDRPQELGIGLAKGGLSFLKKSIFGFSNTIAKVSGSLAKGLSLVTLDEKFQERRRLNQRRNKPKHALYGFASGANSFLESISSGVTGFATAPIEGANTGGASGFFKGVGKGLVGLPTKTAIGFFDLASNISEGIQNTTTAFDAEGLDKVRLPRYISYDNIIRPFSQREAQGQFWLKSIDGGVYFKETYLAHLVLPGEERALIVTFKKMILFEIGTLQVKWVINFDEIKSISIESTGINIGLKRKEGPFIPIPEKASRAFIYGKIGVAVEDYNKHCQVVL